MEPKYYQLFSVNACFDEWSMHEVLIGAESVDDLAENLGNVVTTSGTAYFHKRDVGRIAKEKDTRIFAIDHAYTTKPYTVLSSFAYYE